MIVNAQARPYRYRAMSAGFRRHPAAGRAKEMSVVFRRAVGITLCAACMLVLACGQIFHWAIVKDYHEIDQLRVVSSEFGTENINRLAKRAQLISPKHIEAVAAVRFDLHVPTEGQVHHL